MRILDENVHLKAVIDCYERENQGSPSFDYGKGLLARVSYEMGGSWTRVRLSENEIRNVMLPDHRHPAENPNVLIPKPGLTVSAAAARVKEVTQETGLCWRNINSHKDRDFSQLHIFLQRGNGVFANLDGLHRLLAWAIFEKKDDIHAYIVSLV